MSSPYSNDPYNSNPYQSGPSNPYGSSPYSGAPGDPYQAPSAYSNPSVQPMMMTTPGTSGKAIAALILGLCVFLVGLFAGIPAVILGHMALTEINTSGGLKGGKGMAITGLVLGYLSIAAGVCGILLIILSSASQH